MFPPLVRPVLFCFVPAVLSTRQTPAVLPHSRKRLEFWGAEYGPGPILALLAEFLRVCRQICLSLRRYAVDLA